MDVSPLSDTYSERSTSTSSSSEAPSAQQTVQVSPTTSRRQLQTFDEIDLSTMPAYKMTLNPEVPSTYEYAMLCKAIKQENYGQKLLPQGWQLLLTAQQIFNQDNRPQERSSRKNPLKALWKLIRQTGGIGYRGAVYGKGNGATRNFVIVHDSKFKFSNALKSGLSSTFSDNVSGINWLAREFTRSAYQYFSKYFRGKTYDSGYHGRFSTTGFSLGAWLAEISVWDFHHLGLSAVTFESPGCRPQLLELAQKKFTSTEINHEIYVERLNIASYLTMPNLFNTANAHIGTMYHIFPKLPEQNSVKEWFEHTVSQHNLENIISAISATTGDFHVIKLASLWPVIHFEALSMSGFSLDVASFAKTLRAIYNLEKKVLGEYRAFHKHYERGTSEISAPSEQSKASYFLKFVAGYMANDLVSHQLPLRQFDLPVQRWLRYWDHYRQSLTKYVSDNKLLTSAQLELLNSFTISQTSPHCALIKPERSDIHVFRKKVSEFVYRSPAIIIQLNALSDSVNTSAEMTKLKSSFEHFLQDFVNIRHVLESKSTIDDSIVEPLNQAIENTQLILNKLNTPPTDVMGMAIIRAEQAFLNSDDYQNFKSENKELYIGVRGRDHYMRLDEETFDVAEEVNKFLDIDKNNQLITVIFASAGMGKTLFCLNLVARLWEDFSIGQSIPIYVALARLHQPYGELISESLRNFYGFSEDHIAQLISNRQQFIFVLDGYDELTKRSNLYNSNLALQQLASKIIVTCRPKAFKSDNYLSNFAPYRETFANSRDERAKLNEIFLANFSQPQIESYIIQYCRVSKANNRPVAYETQKDYLRHINEIPGLMGLIENPFALMITMLVLPGLLITYKDPSMKGRMIERKQLYDHFIVRLFDRALFKLYSNPHVNPSNLFGENADAGNWVDWFSEYTKNLAETMRKQNDTKVIEISSTIASKFAVKVEPDEPTFSEWLISGFGFFSGQPEAALSRNNGKNAFKEFFTNDPETQYALRAAPIKRTGPMQYRFFHDSLLEHFQESFEADTIKTMYSVLQDSMK